MKESVEHLDDNSVAKNRGKSSLRRIDILNDAICELFVTVATAPATVYRAEVSVISFNSTARTELPMAPVNSAVTMTTLLAGGATCYSAALNEFEERLNLDERQRAPRRSFRPVAFFLTDGQPTDNTADWVAVCERLAQRRTPSLPPRIIPCPLGEAKPGVLDKLATSHGADVSGFTGQILADGKDIATTIHSIFKIIARTLTPSPDMVSFHAATTYAEQVAVMDTMIGRALAANETTTNFQDYLGGYR